MNIERGNQVSAALEMRNITRRWPGGEPVFKNLSLTVSRGSICCLLGPSGCGKSTLLRCAASLDPVETGETLVDGKTVEGPSRERQLILQDDRQLFPWMTIIENVSFPVRLGDVGNSGGTKKLLNMVGLADSENLYPSQLSGGMKQRAVLARALAAEPELLLLDEPFGALDSEIRKRLHGVILNIHQEKKLTILLVTHDVSEALVLSDTIVYMNSNGELSSPETNPLGYSRDMENPLFFQETLRMRRRYESLLDSVNN
ncbi:MAG: ABC transporter ATP-binding protein [Spirochaetaceae bacterium]|nr:ABC transporter ATP-binding protein [Spirochaetaceae bacterium]